MLRILSIKLRKKSRKYPIKYDKTGRTARQRAFELFDEGLKPAQVAPKVSISVRTARRYYADWKKLPEHLKLFYEMAKEDKKDPKMQQEIIKALASNLDLPEEKVLERLQKPWALKQLVSGKWKAEIEEKRIAKVLTRLDNTLKFLELHDIVGVPLEKIKAALDELEQEYLSSKSNK